MASLTYLRLAQFQGLVPLFPSLRRLQIVNATPSLSHSFLLLSPLLTILKYRGSLRPTLTSLGLSWPTLRILALSCPLLNILETNISLEDIPPIDSTKGYTFRIRLKSCQPETMTLQSQTPDFYFLSPVILISSSLMLRSQRTRTTPNSGFRLESSSRHSRQSGKTTQTELHGGRATSRSLRPDAKETYI